MAAVIVSATLWLLISVVFISGAVEAPPRLVRIGVALLGAEFVLLIAASYSAECPGGPCVGEDKITETTGPWEAIVTYVIPGLTAAFAVYLVVYGVRRHRRMQS